MAYDEGVAERLRELFVDQPGISEKKMFGGLAFMFRGHMLVGIIGESLMARVGPGEYVAALKRPFVRKMDFTGKPIKGLSMWIQPDSSRTRILGSGSICASGSMRPCSPNDKPSGLKGQSNIAGRDFVGHTSIVL